MAGKKVMINCAASIIDRCDKLKPHVASQSLRGKANRSDVVRLALEKGVAQLEQESNKENMH